jgi:hypothetical protein
MEGTVPYFPHKYSMQFKRKEEPTATLLDMESLKRYYYCHHTCTGRLIIIVDN